MESLSSPQGRKKGKKGKEGRKGRKGEEEKSESAQQYLYIYIIRKIKVDKENNDINIEKKN